MRERWRRRSGLGVQWVEIIFAPHYLAQMAMFAVNTGCRDQEICQLRWDWEVKVLELDTSVFLIPGSRVKNGDERLVV